MAQIVQGPPTFAERLGTGIGSGLQQLAALKLQELQNQKAANQLQNVFDFTPQEANFFAKKENQPLFLEFLKRGGGTRQIQQNQDLLQPLREMQSPEQATQQGLQNILQSLGQQSYGKPQEIQQPQQTTIAAQQPEQMQLPKKLSVREQFAQPTAAEKRELKKLELAERKAKTQEEQFERKEARAEREAALKETKELRKDLYEKGKQAKADLDELDILDELNQKGEIDSVGYVEGLKRAGLDIPALLSPDTETYQKTSLGLMRGMNKVFGGKVSNQEMEQFIKTIPTLANSPEGRKRLIANWKRIKRLDAAYLDTQREIIKENKGYPPIDLDAQIDDRIGAKQEKISKLFKEDLAKPVPQGQSKLVTALQAGAGSLVGRLPKAAAGAGIGALAGSRFAGPAGAIPGGILGGLAGLSGISVKDLI